MEINNRNVSSSVSSISSNSEIQTQSFQGSVKEKQNSITENKKSAPPPEGDELNILVAVRCRGRNDREVHLKSPVVVTIPDNSLQQQGIRFSNKVKEVCLNLSDETGISAQLNSKKYLLDQVFGPDSTQDEIFKDIVDPLFYDFLKGFNCTVLCYGMTSTGKTYTMTGDEKLYNGELSSEAGIIPRVLFNLFENLNENRNNTTKNDEKNLYIDYLVKCSFIELYNEDAKDLLSSEGVSSMNAEKKLKIYDAQSSSSPTNITPSTSVFGNDNRKKDVAQPNLQRVNSFSQPTKSSLNGNYTNNGKRMIYQQDMVSRKASLNSSNNVIESNNSNNNKTNSNMNSYDINNTGGGIFIQNLEEFEITEPIEGLKLLQRGLKKRKVAATRMNDVSSRSHSIFSITLYKRVSNSETLKPSSSGPSNINSSELFRVSKMNLVDLAGSENVSRSGAINQRAKEAGSINQSLLTLGRVINALSDSKKSKTSNSHIPFRESKLTRLLQDSLGGNTKTALIATISPAKMYLEETVSTLEYASKAKNIKNKPQMGAVLFKDLLIKDVAVELSKLKNELYFTKQKEGGVFMESERYDSVQRDLENFKIEIQEYKRLNTNLKQQNKLLLLDKENLLEVRQKHERKISELTKVIDYIYEKMDKQHRNEENLVDNAKQLISAINLMKDSIFYYNNQKTQQTTYLKNVLTDSLPQIKDNLIEQLNKYDLNEKQIGSSLLESFKVNLQHTIDEIITKANSSCQDFLNSILTASNLITNDVSDKTYNIEKLLKSHIDLSTKDLMMISEYCNDCHDYLNEKIKNNLNTINSDSTNSLLTSVPENEKVISEQVKKLFYTLESKNKRMMVTISNNIQEQFKQQQHEIIKSITGITKDFHSIENTKLEPINQKIQSVIKLINNSDYQNLNLNENCTKNLNDINSLVVDNKMLLQKKLRDFDEGSNYVDDSKNKEELYNQLDIIGKHLTKQNETLDTDYEKNLNNKTTVNHLSTKIQNIITSTNSTHENQLQNELNLNKILSAIENKNFKPIGSSGKTPLRSLMNSNNNNQDRASFTDTSILQEKLGRINNNRSPQDSEVNPSGNTSNSSNISVKKRKFSNMISLEEGENNSRRKKTK